MKAYLSVMLATLFAVAPAWAQTLDKGLPAAGSTIALKPTSAGYEAFVTVSPDAGFSDIKIKSSDATLAGVLDQRVDKDENQHVKLVTVLVKTGALRQGAYPITLVATDKVATGKVVTERDVWLTVPAVKIDPPDTLVIVREKGWGGTTIANQLQLWETTQRAWLTGIRIAQKGDTDAGGEPAGRIKATATKIDDIPPGGNGLIEFNKHYVLGGDFPLGTAKGKLVVQADQLADAVSVGFEIRSRIRRLWLFVTLLVGLAVGWATRFWLQGELTLNQERQRTFALIDMIDEALTRNKDALFQTQAKREARDVAAAAAEKKKVEEVKSATTAAQSAFQQALDDLQRRRAELDQAIAKLLALVRAGWRVPPALGAELRKAKSALEKGLPGLDMNDVAEATTELDNQRKALATAADSAGRDWLTALDQLDAALDAAASLLGDAAASVKSAAKSIPDSFASALDQLEKDPTAAVERLQVVFEKLHAGVFHLENLLGDAKAAVERQIGRWDATLAAAKLPQPQLWRDWKAKARDFATALREAAADPGQRLRQLGSEAPLLLDNLKGVLVDQVTESDALNALFRVGKYNEAVTKVAELAAADRAKAEGRLMGEGRPVEGPAAVETTAIAVSSVATPSLVYGFSALPSGGLPPLAVLAAMSRRAVEVTSFFLSLIYAALIAGAGYFLFADKWIGTPLDFATVFFWAFATDVGAEVATAAARGLKKG